MLQHAQNNNYGTYSRNWCAVPRSSTKKLEGADTIVCEMLYSLKKLWKMMLPNKRRGCVILRSTFHVIKSQEFNEYLLKYREPVSSSVLKGRLGRHWPTLLFSGILCTVLK